MVAVLVRVLQGTETMPTRFPGGLTNVKDGAFQNLTLPYPLVAHTYFNDFDTYAAGDWTITTTGSGTVALTDGDGGLLLITNSAADNDAVFLDKKGSSFLMETNKQAWFGARFKVSDATQSDLVVGLQITDTTPLAVSDGIWFQKDDGDTHIDVYCGKSAGAGTTSALDIAELADATFIELAWWYDGASAVTAWVNGSKVATLDASSTYLPDAALTVSFGLQNGEAVAKTMTVDWLYALKER